LKALERVYDPPLAYAVRDGFDVLLYKARRSVRGDITGDVALQNGATFARKNGLSLAKEAERQAYIARGLEQLSSTNKRAGHESSNVDGSEITATLLAVLDDQETRLSEAAQTATSSTGQYLIHAGRICRLVEDTPVSLCNFVARIESEEVIDDGAEQRTDLTISLTLDTGQCLGTQRVPLAQYPSMRWPVTKFGMQAVVNAGVGAADHLRATIQVLSPNAKRAYTYAHTGWKQLDGTYYFLHAGGGIGPVQKAPMAPVLVIPKEPAPMITTTLAGNLALIRFPEPPHGTALVTAVRASLALLDVAPDTVMAPILAGAYRPPLNEVLTADVSIFLEGQSGVFKSELSALAQAHYGAGFNRLTLPAQWSATANALERNLFEAKDCLLTVDDFAPRGTPQEQARLHATADRAIRGAGNRAGRGRMNADGTMRPDYPPRGMLLASGEDFPRGHSLGARLEGVHVAQGDVSLPRLSAAQTAAARGDYAAAMAGYVAWLAPQIDELRKSLPVLRDRLRDDLLSVASHARTPANIANLLTGWKVWLRFAVEVNALTEQECAVYWERVRCAFVATAAQQSAVTSGQAPAQQFMDLLNAAISGHRAYVTDLDGERPAEPGRWGWRLVPRMLFDKDQGCMAEESVWEIAPGSAHVGWLAPADTLYLLPDVAYSVAQRLASEKHDALTLTDRSLWKRLHEAGTLATIDEKQGKHVVKRRINNARPYILHVFVSALAACRR
jgi:hypothetical protein